MKKTWAEEMAYIISPTEGSFQSWSSLIVALSIWSFADHLFADVLEHDNENNENSAKILREDTCL